MPEKVQHLHIPRLLLNLFFFLVLSIALAGRLDAQTFTPSYSRLNVVFGNYTYTKVFQDKHYKTIKGELLRDGIVIRTDTESIDAIISDQVESGDHIYSWKYYYQVWHDSTDDWGAVETNEGACGGIRAGESEVYGMLLFDDSINADNLDISVIVPPGVKLSISGGSINAGSIIDAYGSISLTNVELYGTIEARGGAFFFKCDIAVADSQGLSRLPHAG